jgi:hypothetical protein
MTYSCEAFAAESGKNEADKLLLLGVTPWRYLHGQRANQESNEQLKAQSSVDLAQKTIPNLLGGHHNAEILVVGRGSREITPTQGPSLNAE